MLRKNIETRPFSARSYYRLPDRTVTCHHAAGGKKCGGSYGCVVLGDSFVYILVPYVISSLVPNSLSGCFSTVQFYHHTIRSICQTASIRQ